MQQKREQKENIFQWFITLPNQPIIFTTFFVLLPAVNSIATTQVKYIKLQLQLENTN